MYIKLNFTSAKTGEQVFRILADIINNPTTITSLNALVTRFGDTAYYAANDLAVGFDSTNSEIIATTPPTTAYTKAHVARTIATANTFTFTLEQSVYDSLSTKYYTRIYASANDANIYHQVGDSITGGTITSSQIDKTTLSGTATLVGTSLTLVNGYTLQASEVTNTQNLVIRTLWCYITDKTFLLGFNGTTNSTIGWNSNYANASYTSSNIFVSQYTRLDHWNTVSNGVIPVVFTKPRTLATYNCAGMFANTNDYGVLWNPANSGVGFNFAQPLLQFNGYNTYPSTSLASPTKLYNQYCPHGVGLKNSEIQPIQTNIVPDTGATAISSTTGSYAPINLTTVSTGVPNSTLTARTFPLYPLTWMNSKTGAYGGGNISEQSGFYVFAGDYGPGDEFVLNSVTYSIWPAGAASTSTSRLGIAVPKI